MKRFCCSALAAIGCSAVAFAQTPVIDGALDSIYCNALSIQDTQTNFGDAGQGQVDQAFGSELDNAYAYINSGILYLFIGGNLEPNNNDLEIFFDTRAGGQNRLQGDNPNVDSNGLNRMGDNGSGNGLTFDAAFTADYYLTIQGSNTVNGFELRAHYAELRAGANPGVGYFLGTGRFANLTSGGALTGGEAGAPVVLVTINNSNTAGVSGGVGIELDGGAGVGTGIEIAIPLAALGNPTGDFRVTAFVNGAQHDFLSNQSLAGQFGGLGGNLGEPRNVNFNNIPLDQYFTVPITTPPCGACCVGQECLVSTQTQCQGQGGSFQGVNASCVGNPCDAAATGACCRGTACTIETQVECVNGGGAYFGNDTTCASFPCQTIGACCLPNNTCQVLSETQCANAGGDYRGGGAVCADGLCTLGACCLGTTGTMCQQMREYACLNEDGVYQGAGTTCPNAACVGGACCIDNLCFTVRGGSTCGQQGGTYLGDNVACTANSCGAPPAAPPINGTCEASYGSALAIQDIQTQFGNSDLGQVDFANGSELDSIAAQVVEDVLYLCIAGNLESNFNKLELFIDSRPGGQNRILGTNPDVDFNAINRQGDDGSGNGLRFDDTFEADYYFTMSHGSQPGRPTTALFANFAELFVDDNNPGIGYFLGEGRAANYTNSGLLDRNAGGNNPFGIRATINNSNTAGVAGGTLIEPDSGAGVMTGIELSIPLDAIGSPEGDIRVVLYVNGQGHDFASNQWLDSLGGVGEVGNLGDPRLVDLAVIPGTQWVLIPLSDPCAGVICGDSNLSGNVSVSDIALFVQAVSQGFAAWDAAIPGAQTMQQFLCANDTNGNGVVSVGDIGTFVGVVTGQSGCQ